MVECNLAKVEVAGSNPVSRSKIFRHPVRELLSGRVLASQAGGRGFKSRFPLHFFSEPAEFSAGSFFCLPLFPRHVWGSGLCACVRSVRCGAWRRKCLQRDSEDTEEAGKERSPDRGGAAGSTVCPGPLRDSPDFFQLSRDFRSVPAVFSLMGPRSAGSGNVCGLDAKKPAAGEQPASERKRRRDVLPYIFF